MLRPVPLNMFCHAILYASFLVHSWLEPLRKLVDEKVSAKFGEFFRQMNCAGEVRLKENEVLVHPSPPPPPTLLAPLLNDLLPQTYLFVHPFTICCFAEFWQIWCRDTSEV